MNPDTRSLLKPPALALGDKVGIIAPASQIERDRLEAGCTSLRNMGYEPFYFDSILDSELYFAGSAARRARELEEMLERPDVRAVICARGGYGCNYLLPLLDLAKIRRNPKILVGYSDTTTLLTYFTDTAGLVTFHGPMATKDFADSRVHQPSWKAAVTGVAEWELDSQGICGFKPLVSGSGEGRLYGGCLSMLAASLGTPYEAQTQGTLLFLEDVGAKPYQVDRMLMQLKLAGKLAGVRGVIFGEMLDCTQPSGQAYSLEEVVTRVVGGLGVPVAYGLSSGHVSRDNVTLPLGLRAQLVVGEYAARLKILEAAVE